MGWVWNRGGGAAAGSAGTGSNDGLAPRVGIPPPITVDLDEPMFLPVIELRTVGLFGSPHRMVVMRRHDARAGDEEYAVYDPRNSDRFQVPDLSVALRFFVGTLEAHAASLDMRDSLLDLEVVIPGTTFVGMIDYNDSIGHRIRELSPSNMCSPTVVAMLTTAISLHLPSRMCVVKSKKRLRDETLVSVEATANGTATAFHPSPQIPSVKSEAGCNEDSGGSGCLGAGAGAGPGAGAGAAGTLSTSMGG